MNEVVERQADAVATTQSPPQSRQLSVVEYAVQSGAPVAEVRALVELQIQMDNHRLAMRQHDDARDRELRAEAARNAYTQAMAAFKSKVMAVVRSKDITDGPLKGKKHADLYAVVEASTEELSKLGLSTTFETLEDGKDWIRIGCRVKHVAGHSEMVAFGGPVDTGPGRNAIQARKSSVSYLERITMLLALGLAEKDADDDGAGGPDDSIEYWSGKAALAMSVDELKKVSKAGQREFRGKDRIEEFKKFQMAVQARGTVLRAEEAKGAGNV